MDETTIYPSVDLQGQLETRVSYKGKDLGGGKRGELLKCYTSDEFGDEEFDLSDRNWFQLDFECNCWDKESCSLNFKNQVWDLQPTCKQEIQKRYKTNKAAVNKTVAEPILMVIANC